MRWMLSMLLAMGGMWGGIEEVAAEVSRWRFGGRGGQPWPEWTALNVLMDEAAVPGALQPRELKPDENFLPTLGPWQRWKFPIDLRYRAGHPRIWRGINYLHPSVNPPLVYVDGDPTTYNADTDFGPGGNKVHDEFYTIDMGRLVPVERFVFYPPEGADPFTGEPYRPNYALKKFELSASRDEGRVGEEEGDEYRPLDILVAQVEQNFDPITEVHFSLQYLRFFRLRAFPDRVVDGTGIISRLAYAEMEVYGRGFVPQAMWESQVVDIGQEVNFGRVHFGVSRWRREGEELVSAAEGMARGQVEVKTGQDTDPQSYLTYTDIGELAEVSQDEYARLKPRIWPWDPPVVGWRGPIVEDRRHWSFWSAPLRVSGEQPRVPGGRYFQVRVRLETEGLWEYARLESLAVEISPWLAEQVVGEVAVADQWRPEGKVAQMEVGEETELVLDLKVRFSGEGQGGFDAVRVRAPGPAVFRGLAWGEPLAAAKPDSTRQEEQGFVVYLPGRVGGEGERRVRIELAGVLYGTSGEFGGEVFTRGTEDLPQWVEAGDVGAEIGTDQLRVVGIGASAELVLGQVEVVPQVCTPQGDGVNEGVLIGYSLYRVMAEVAVEVAVYALGGERLWRAREGVSGSGRHAVKWDGRDEEGRLVPPGLYLVRVGVETDRGTFARLRPLAVTY